MILAAALPHHGPVALLFTMKVTLGAMGRLGGAVDLHSFMLFKADHGVMAGRWFKLFNGFQLGRIGNAPGMRYRESEGAWPRKRGSRTPDAMAKGTVAGWH